MWLVKFYTSWWWLVDSDRLQWRNIHLFLSLFFWDLVRITTKTKHFTNAKKNIVEKDTTFHDIFLDFHTDISKSFDIFLQAILWYVNFEHVFRCKYFNTVSYRKDILQEKFGANFAIKSDKYKSSFEGRPSIKFWCNFA